MSLQDMADMAEWYEEQAERAAPYEAHAAGECDPEDCAVCEEERYHEDAYDRMRDDRLTEGL